MSRIVRLMEDAAEEHERVAVSSACVFTAEARKIAQEWREGAAWVRGQAYYLGLLETELEAVRHASQ